MALTFKAGLPGLQNIYMATGAGSLWSNWQQMGTWTTTSVSSQPPTIISETPGSGTGLTQTFSYVASSVNGYGYIMQMQVLFNTSVNGTGACYIYYNRFQNNIYFMNDAGNSWSTMILGTPGTLSNSQCTVDTGASTASGSGNNLTLNLTITFNASWAGTKNNYLYVYDRALHGAGFQQMGTWTVGSPPPPPEVNTYYTYDVVGHLTQVSMPRPTGTQTRTFVYNSAQQLASTTNPENGTVTYTYNIDGTLATRIDAKNQKVAYTYDSYKRVTQIRRYPVSTGAEDTCQRTDFYYDTNPFDGSFAQYTTSRATAVQWGGASCPAPYQFTEMYSYSPGGLVTKKRLTASGAQPLTLNTQQTYDNEGRVTGVTYPDMYQNLNGGVPFVFQAGKTYGYSYDTMGRPAGMSESAVDWVKEIQYGAANQLTQIKYRNTASTLPSTDFSTETRTYNTRLQLTRLQDSIPGISNNMDLEYRYSATQNNGQITQQKDWLSGEEVSYTYDNLQRLISAVTTGPEWGQGFSYDGFGNRTGATVTNGTAPSSSFTIDPATNRVVDSGFSYDANGNMTAGAGITSAVYDVENRMVSVTGTGAELYAYGATNKRIWKKKPSGDEEIYFYGIGGQKLVTYTKTVTYNAWEVQGGTNLYFGSRAIVMRGVTTTSDRLGSRGSYFPYGEEKQVTSQDKEKFATYYRDGTTGLDYAQNRYYANTLGRFTSPDPYKASGGTSDPGSWNRYAYVQGDPANNRDPSGLFIERPKPDDIVDAEWIQCPDGSYNNMTTGLAGCPSLGHTYVQQNGEGGVEVASKPCDMGNEANAKIINFTKANRPAADQLSAETGLNANFILAWAGLEAGWGAGGAARLNNNYFGLATNNWPGTIACPEGSFAGFACFSTADGFSLLLSGRSALSSKGGRYLTPALAAQNSGGSAVDIARAISAAGFNTEHDNDGTAYGKSVGDIWDSLMRRINCP